MKNKYVHYGLVLLIIAGISAGLLGFINSKTAPIIARSVAEAENQARKEVMPAAASFEMDKTIEEGGYGFIPSLDANGELVGYVTKASENGFNGAIEFMVGIGLDGKVTGLKVTSQGETPGLGAKISTEPDWGSKWIGRDANYQFDKAVDAFGGATISPMAVYTGLIKALKAFAGVAK